LEKSIQGVCIVIVSFNRLPDLQRCLTSISQVLSNKDKVVVIDNHSADIAQLHQLIRSFPQFIWELNTINIGFAGGNHQGVRKALQHGCEYIFLLNPDTEIFPDTIEKLIDASKKAKDEWIIGPLLISPGERNTPRVDSAGLSMDRFYRAIDKFQGKALSQLTLPEEPFSVDGLCGAAILIPTKLFPLRNNSEFTVFDESYFAYFEDVEFSRYWKEQGHDFGLVPQARVMHYRGRQSALSGITYQRWKGDGALVRQIILNRYRTIVRYETRRQLLKNALPFFSYELARCVYILLRKPFLLPLICSGWKMVFAKVMFPHASSPEQGV